MRAFWYEKAGGPEVIQSGTVEILEPAKGEVKVRLSYSAINPTDVKRRSTGRELSQFSRIIPNNDGAGVIEAVGPGVSDNRLGERVWIFGAQAGRAEGTAADYVVLPSRQAIRLPDGVELKTGACLGVPAVTAHCGLFSDGSIAGQTIFITGGTGRVGNCAVQLAKWAGATVIATASSAEKQAHVASLGADLVLDYNDPDIPGKIKDFAEGGRVDRILDTAFSQTVQFAPDILKARGVIATYSSDADPRPQIPFPQLMYLNTTIRAFGIYGLGAEAQDRAFHDINVALKSGALSSHRVDRELAFEEIGEGHRIMEEEKLWGCLLIKVS